LRLGPTLPHAVYQHLHFEGPFGVRIDRDHSFRLHSYGTCVENELFWGGFGTSWEAMSLRVWEALCRSRRGLAIDVGANTGVYALAAAALGQEVIAFEPIERMANRLRHNVALNSFPIVVEQKAASNQTGRLPIYDAMTEHNYSASLEGQGPNAVSYEVDVCSLDDYFAENGSPAIGVLKIDVERHEPAVLRGMARTLDEQAPPMLVEILDTEIGREIQALLGQKYRVFHVDEKRGLIAATELGPVGDHSWNHLVCTQDQYDQAGLEKLAAFAR
jgi:FkbM family methyltransferase